MGIMFRLMMFNDTFNNLSAISWLSVFLVEEIGVTGENHQVIKKLYHIILHQVHGVLGRKPPA